MRKDLKHIGQRISASLEGAEILAAAYVARIKEKEREKDNGKSEDESQQPADADG